VAYGFAIILLIFCVAVVVVRPLQGGKEKQADVDSRRAALEAARDSKYREIRDAQLDFQMGKLTASEYRDTDSELRRQAIEILYALDRNGGSEPE
jgi:flagellar biosynthesis/type III secretory pathway M-ring protein FliF/YscJ